MNFITAVQAEIDTKYSKMLNQKMEAPFHIAPKIGTQDSYSAKRNAYYA